jgi:hypothetical protein
MEQPSLAQVLADSIQEVADEFPQDITAAVSWWGGGGIEVSGLSGSGVTWMIHPGSEELFGVKYRDPDFIGKFKEAVRARMLEKLA